MTSLVKFGLEEGRKHLLCVSKNGIKVCSSTVRKIVLDTIRNACRNALAVPPVLKLVTDGGTAIINYDRLRRALSYGAILAVVDSTSNRVAIVMRYDVLRALMINKVGVGLSEEELEDMGFIRRVMRPRGIDDAIAVIMRRDDVGEACLKRLPDYIMAGIV